MRVRNALAIAAAALLLAPASMSSQTQSVLKKTAPPLKGTAELGFIQTAKLEGNEIVTTFQVKNMSATNAIVGLQISEFWYDKAGSPVQGTGDRKRLPRPLAPLDVATIVLRSPKVTGMTTPQYKFEHNNGIVKPVSMKNVKQLKPGPNT